MSSVLDFLKATSRLSSLPLIVVMVGIGTVMLYRSRTRRVGRIWLTCFCLGFWFASIPIGSALLAWSVATRVRPIQFRTDADGANAIVMLGAGINSHVAYGIGIDDLGASALRVIETVRLYRMLGHPLVIVSGGGTQRLFEPRTEAAAYRQAAIQLGIPPDRIVMEDRSRTTREEALLLKPILARLGIGRFVLVSAPTHIPRAMKALRAVGLDPIPSPTPMRTGTTPMWSPLPERESLGISDDAIYDILATMYYRLRG
ncbi:MAG TPA: YdcF family protein, partial [Vicinamibacterales bacterium]|nr:YdcF family protein [Vicinamibacterales bacterium]